jgi:hypothetical protein
MVLKNFITIVCCALLVCVCSVVIYQAVTFTNGTTIINQNPSLPSGNVVIDGALTVLGPVSIEPPQTLELTSVTKNGTTLNWPLGDGAPGSVLATDGSGNLSFQSAPGGGNVIADPVFSAQNKLVRTNFASGSTTIQESNISVGNDTLSGLSSVTSTVFNGDLNGNASSATSFSGVLDGDVVGPQSATEVKQVGTVSAAQIQTGVLNALSATSSNSLNQIVKRDGLGGFSAGTIIANGFVGNLVGNVNGTASNAVNATNAVNFTSPLIGDVIGTQDLTEVKTVGGKTALAVANAVNVVDAATNNSNPNSLVLRDSNGNFSSQTITANNGFIGNLTGNASTSTFATTSGSASSATTFTGSLDGDVKGPQTLTVVAKVGTVTAAQIQTGVLDALFATNANTPDLIVKRDGSGGFSAGTIVATGFIGNLVGDVNGIASNAVNATNAINFTAPLIGDVIGTQDLTEVKTVGGKTALAVANAVNVIDAATNNPSPNTLVLRDLNGNFSSQTITANTGFIGNLTGNASTATFATTAGSASSATTFTDPLAGDVTGTQFLTIVSKVGNKTASAIASTVDTVNAASTLSVPDTLVLRDASSNFQINEIVSNRITVNGTVSNATDAATKQYVDTAVVTGVLVPKASVNALASTFIVLNGLQTIDSVPLNANDRVLITNQGNNGGLPNINNGIWIVAAGPWTRAADLPAASTAQQAYVLVQNGPVPNVYGGSSWICNTPAAIVGTNPVGFVEFSVADSVTAANVGTGVGLFKNKTANDLNFKTLLPTGHIQIVPDVDEVYLSTDAVSTNTPNTLVVRNGSGDFAANQITASLIGSASQNVLKVGDTMSGSLIMENNAQLRLLDTGTSFYVGIKAPGSMAANYAFSLPANAPSSGQVLVATSASTTQWATPGGGFLAKPRTIFVSKAGSNVVGQGTALSPYLTVSFALTQALAANPSITQPIVILVGAGVFTETNPMVISQPGITLMGVSLTGTWIVPSDLTSDLFQITTPSFEFANMTLSTLGGPSSAAAINVTTTSFGNSGLRTVFVTGFQTGVSLASTSSSNIPITIFGQFNCVGNQNSVVINDNVRAVMVDVLILGAFPGSSTPVYTGISCVGSNSLMTIHTLSLRSLVNGLVCDGGIRVRMTGSAIVDNCTNGYIIKGASSMDCTAANFTNNNALSVNIFVTDANTTATFVGCSINGLSAGISRGTGVQVQNQAQVSITGSTISHCDVGVICGQSTDTNTTKLICSSVSLQNCDVEIAQAGSSVFVFTSGQFEPNLTSFNDTTNVTLNAFDQTTNGTLTIGNSSDVDSTIYQLFTNSVSLPKLEYKANMYGLKGPMYQDLLNGCFWGTYSEPENAFLYSVVGDNTKVAGIRLISDTNNLGDNDDTRGWIIQKDGTNANLSFYYENNDGSGLALRGLNQYLQYDGQRNALSFVNTSVAPAPNLPYTKLIWGVEADNVNLYRGSVAGFLQTDSKFTVTSLTANRAVVTDGTSTLTSSATTATELGYVSGVTSSIQSQLNSKLSSGGGTLTGGITLPNGGLSNLALNFSGSLITGLFLGGSTLNFVTNGSNRFIIERGSGQITMSSLAGSPGVVHSSASGALSNSLIVDADITNNTITDSKLQTILTAGKVANSATTATSANTLNTIVLRDASGNFSAGTVTANLSGNASSANTAISFSGQLLGDVSGFQNTTKVDFVGNQTAANVAAATVLANAATSDNTPSTIVKRDASGNFITNNVTLSSLSTGVVHSNGSGVLSSSLVVGSDIASNTIPDSCLQTISIAGKVANSATTATSANTENAIVARDASGNFSAGTITANTAFIGNLTGNASTATFATTSGSASSATTFTDPLDGDVKGHQTSTFVAKVGSVTSAQIQTGVLDALFATNANTPDLIVKRDGSGGFSAGTIIATGFIGNLVGDVNGTASNAINATNAINFTAPLVGDVIGTQYLTEVKTVGGKAALLVANAVNVVDAATNDPTPNTLVLRDLNGNFASQTITANTGFIGNLTGNASTATFATTAGSASSATTFTDPLAGDVTGTQSLTVVAKVGGKTASEIKSTVDTVNAATSLSFPNTLVLRDASGTFQTNQIVLNSMTINDPIVNPTDAATKKYVDDTVISGVLVPKASVNALASTIIVLNGLQTIDSVPLVAGNRVLVTNQGNNGGLPNINNGIWIVAAGAWTRSADLPAGSTAQQAYALVQNGPVPNVYGGSSWICNTPTAIVGTNPVGFVEFSIADSVTAANVGTGVGLFKNKTANDLNFKTLLPTGHIQIVPDVDEVYLSTDAVSTNTPNTLVVRDGSGNFAANQITASLIGSASQNVLKGGDTMSGSLIMDNNAQLRLLDTGTSFYVGIKAPGSMAANYDFSLPPNAPSSGQVLVATSASTTQWATPGGGFLAKPRTIFVSKAGSNVTGQGTALSPYLTVAFAITQALAASPSVLQPIVILIGAGVFTETNPMVISQPGITILGVSLTGTWIVPSNSNSDLFQITTPSFEFANMTLSTLGGPSSAAAINVTTTSFGNSGLRTLLVTGFQTGVRLASTSNSNVPITIFAQFNCVGNQSSLIINDNVRAVIVDALILGAFPGSSTPVYTGISCVGSNSLVTIQSLSLRLLQNGLVCDGGVRVKMTGGASVDNCYQGYRIQGGASMDCVASTFTTNAISSINIWVTDANTTATFVGCLINGSLAGELGVLVASQAQASITGSTISNCDIGIQTVGTSTTKMVCSSVSIQNCGIAFSQIGLSTFIFLSGEFDRNLVTIEDATNVTINAFDEPTNGTLTIGNSSDVDSTIYQLFTNSVSLPKLEYKANMYGLKGPIYQDLLNGCVWGTYSQPADAFLYSVVGNNTKVAGIRLISDTNIIGNNDDTRGWIIQKDGTNANLSFYYENKDSSGLSLRGLNRYFEYDGQRNALSFVNTSVAPAPNLPYTKLIWGLEADNVNLYRGSLAGFLQTDSKFTVNSLTANRAVVTDGTSTLTSSATTATEIGYVNGVTSSIQAQLDSKFPSSGGTLTGPLTLPAGSQSNLSLNFTNYSGSGLFSDAGKLNLVTNGLNRLIIDQSSGQITMSSLAGSPGVVHASASGELSNSLIVDADISNNTITDSKLQTISTAGKVANSATTATNANTADTIVARDASGNFITNNVTLSGLSTGVVHSNASGVLSSSLVVGSDIASDTIPDSCLQTISTAGKVANSATTATSANTVDAIVARDASGNFTAGTITASLSGNATTSTNTSNVGGQTAANVEAATVLANAATSANTFSTIVRRDASGNFSAGTISASSMNLTNTTNQIVLSTNNGTFTLTPPTNNTGNRVYTIPDSGTNAEFIMSAGNQSVNGVKTFNSAPRINLTSNQLIVGQAPNQTTISVATPSGNLTYTVPNTATNAEFVMTWSNQTINAAKTFTGITTISNATSSSTTTTGALVVTGGLGLGGQLRCASSIILDNNRSYSIKDTGGVDKQILLCDNSNTVKLNGAGGSVYINPDASGNSTLIGFNNPNNTEIYYGSGRNLRSDASGIVIGESTATRGLTLNNSTANYTPALLNYYEEFSTTFTFNDNGTNISLASTLKLIRTGKQVTAQVYEMPGFTDSAPTRTASITTPTATPPVPIRFRPLSNLSVAVLTYIGSWAFGNCRFDTSGAITVWARADLNTIWIAGTNANFIGGITASWNLN